MAEIRLSGVNKVYPGGMHAVHDVDLHIADGEFMIMVGPSGCAKSTILRMIAGLETPTSGTVEIGGRVVNDVAPKDRDIAMVFQSYALYPHMTVRENMAFGLRLRRMPPSEIDQRVADAARILGLEQLLDRLPKAMSGGQRQRVAMGRAIVREPQAFLMDEPLSNLDAKLRVQMRTEIAKLHQRLETTTVYVTHDQVEAMTLGQRICILRKGVVQQVDTPFQVYQNPSNVFVGGFMGSPGMNFMTGHLKLHDGVLYLQVGEQHLPVPASVSSRLVATTDLHGRGVIVGIRPEHLSMSTLGDPGAVPVRVELTEAMGSEVYAYFTANVTTPDLTALSDTQATSDTFVARLGSGTETRSGEQIMLRPDMDEVHLFDAQSMLTLLSPASEGEVRSRQCGHAIQVASGVASSVTSPVAAPPAPTLVHAHAQAPVIHLHQTIVQPEQPAFAPLHSTVGTLPEHASPAAIASVFDRPVAASFHVEPLVVGAPHASAAASGGSGSPHGAHPRSAFGGRPPGMGVGGAGHPTGPYARLGAADGGSRSRAHERADAHETVGGPGHGHVVGGAPSEPTSPELPRKVAHELAHEVVGVTVPEMVVDAGSPVNVGSAVGAGPPATVARRGFAPRTIGVIDAPTPAAHLAAVAAAGPGAATQPLAGTDLDAAIEAIDAMQVPAGAGDANAVKGPAIAPVLAPRATSSFREALARIQTRPEVTPPTFKLAQRITSLPPVELRAPTESP